MKEKALLVLFFIGFISALYEDQAGKNDWYKENIGKIQKAQFASSKRVVVSTDQHFLAALNLGTGHTFWRQHQPNDEEVNYIHLHESNEVITVTGKAQRVALWDTGSGALIWDIFTQSPHSVNQILRKNKGNPKISVDLISEKNLLVILVETWLRVHELKTGILLWNKTLPTSIDNSSNNKDSDEEEETQSIHHEFDSQHLQYHLFRGSNNLNNIGGESQAQMKESICIVGVHEKINNNPNNQNNNNNRINVVRTLLEMCFNFRNGKKTIRATKEKFPFTEYNPSSHSSLPDSFSLPFQCVSTSQLLVCLSSDKKNLYTYQVGSHSIVSFSLSDIDPSAQYSPEDDLPRIEGLFSSEEISPIGRSDSGGERDGTGGGDEYIVLRSSDKHTLLLKLKSSTSHKKPSLIYSFQSDSEIYRVFGPIVRGPNSEFYLPSAITSEDKSQVEVLALSTGKMEWFNLPNETLKTSGPITSIYLFGKGTEFLSSRKVLCQRADGSLTVWQSISEINDKSVEPEELYIKQVWVRQETLASLRKGHVFLIDLPHDEKNFETQTLKEEFQISAKSNVIVAFIERITSEIHQLKEFISEIHQMILGYQNDNNKETNKNKNKEENNSKEGLYKDRFGMNKLIVGLSEDSTVVGIHSKTSHLVWKTYLPNIIPAKLVLSRLPLYSPQCTVIGSHKRDGRSLLVKIDAMSGDIQDIQYLPYQIHESFVLPYFDNNHNRILAFMDLEQNVHFFPESEETSKLVQDFIKTGFLYFIKDNVLTGFTLQKDSTVKSTSTSTSTTPAALFWSTAFNGQEEKILDVAFPREDEHIHTFVRILGDRSVLVKYLNKNMIIVGTQFSSINTIYNEETDEREEKIEQSISIYLIDTVTGNVIERFVHRYSSPPFSLVCSENFVVYSYWNTKAYRVEVSVLELFEHVDPFNHTKFSSFDEHKLNILQQSYIFPSPVISMGVTTTARGITGKQLIFGLDSGQVVSIDKRFLDPRRPRKEDFQPLDREEGLVPYNPLLTPPLTTYLTYNKTVSRLRGIATSGTELESQSLVFVYGTDLFFTVVSPSKGFDVLSDDFNQTTLIGTVTVLVLLTIASQWLIKRKELMQAWK